MKRRTTVLAAALSLLPLGQPLLMGSATALVTAEVVLSTQAAHAQSADDYVDAGIEKGISGDTQGAITDFTKAIEIDPQDNPTRLFVAYYNRGNAKGLLKDYHGSIIDFNKAIEINPEDATTYYSRGLAKRRLGDNRGAILDYNKAIAINPEYANAYSNRGVAKMLLGDQRGMCLDFKKSSSLGNKNALNALVKLKSTGVCQ